MRGTNALVYFTSLLTSFFFTSFLVETVLYHFNVYIPLMTLFLFSLTLSVLFTIFFLFFDERVELKENNVESVESPSMIVEPSGFTFLKNIEPMKRVIMKFLRYGIKYYPNRKFIRFIVDFNLSVFVLSIALFVTNLLLHLNLGNSFWNYVLRESKALFPIPIYPILLYTIFFLSVFLHELFHVLSSKYSEKSENLKFISSGIGIVFFSPVAYVLLSLDNLEEFITRQIAYGGVLANALLSTILLFLFILTRDVLFFFTSLVNFILFITNVAPIMKFVDGKYIVETAGYEKEYRPFYNDVSTVINYSILVAINYYLIDIEILKKIFLFFSLLLIISVVTESIFRKFNVKKRYKEVGEVRFKLTDEMIERLKFKHLIKERGKYYDLRKGFVKVFRVPKLLDVVILFLFIVSVSLIFVSLPLALLVVTIMVIISNYFFDKDVKEAKKVLNIVKKETNNQVSIS